MQTLNALTYSQSVWGFQPGKAIIRRVCDNHVKGILGYWKLGGATIASMEGFNGKVRWLIKQAFGFRDFKYFRLKIFDLPSTDIRKKTLSRSHE